ncbi:YeeE/YedE family protein [Stenotrophomonas sp. STM01]|uniref:YeeE/YedE family protein n=1 Tax=Stenotrophomonas sp. STM01 TaxID=2769278 RepID=UPI00177DEFC2|nr:YeeE/YedE family protein [Stenotrophomonas sp. STM01]MBD9535129.1 YeeE/YedE family protein [Stenotrophomonas sp. STM01]
MNTHARITLAALLSGALFGLGLAVSGMTDPQRILGFLDVSGDFDPALLFVLGGAVLTTLVLFRFVLRRPAPVLAERFQIPALKQIDRPLLLGAALFGIGWGLAGYCPGPALVGLGVLSPEALWFVPAMLLGMYLHRWLRGR